jgi:coniferyl-aldehyde dehydrogenase
VDYLYVPNAKVQEFTTTAKDIIALRYPSIDSTDYTSLIDDRSFQRVVGALQEAQEKGATLVQLVPGKPWDETTRKIAPHIVLNAPADCALRTREIFGPVLPIVGYDSLDTVIHAINSAPRPLAMYPFTNDRTVSDRLINFVMSGGVCINDAILHAAQHDMPFGGVGESGMGHYHGYEGFQTFSKMRPVFHQAWFSAIKFMWPPYGKFATTYLNFITKK